jgi:predicted LPLAT superfamily acyltransferase
VGRRGGGADGGNVSVKAPLAVPLAAPPAAPPAAASRWTEQSERSAQWVLRLMSWIARHAGRRIARLILHPIALYFLVTGDAARRASQSFLERALRRPVRWADSYRHLHCFACTVLDRVYLLQGRHALFEVSLCSSARVDALLARGSGALLVGAHLGSFEVLRAVGDKQGLRVAMLMFEDNARLIGATLAAVAPKATLKTIALGHAESMLELRRWLEQGGVAGILADRTLPGPHAATAPAHASRSRLTRLPFLGDAAQFSDGPFRLAALLRRPVVFMAGLYLGANRYQIRLVEIDDFSEPAAAGMSADARIARAMQRYVETLELLCVEAPLNWFNFFDFWADDGQAV